MWEFVPLTTKRIPRRFTDFIHAQFTNVDPNKIRISKKDSRRIALECDVKIPAYITGFPSVDEIDFSVLPERFVLKADNLAAKRGVYLLERRADGFIEHLRKSEMSADDIKADLRSAIGARKQNTILVEEMVPGENEGIPFDYKFYMFGERNPYILQINRNTKPNELSIFGTGFSEIDPGLVRIGKPGKLVEGKKPRNADIMMQVARKLAVHLDRPFVSVDLYTSGEEVYLGEMTPSPGAPYYGSMVRFSDEFDVELGTYWRLGYEERGWQIPPVDGETPAAIRARRNRELEFQREADDAAAKTLTPVREELDRAESQLKVLQREISSIKNGRAYKMMQAAKRIPGMQLLIK